MNTILHAPPPHNNKNEQELSLANIRNLKCIIWPLLQYSIPSQGKVCLIKKYKDKLEGA
jgi:hypothetical protein